MILHVFDLEVNVKGRNVTGGPKIDLNYLDNLNVDNKYNCIINLIDINDSWVPIDTGHWRSNISHTLNITQVIFTVQMKSR